MTIRSLSPCSQCVRLTDAIVEAGEPDTDRRRNSRATTLIEHRQFSGGCPNKGNPLIELPYWVGTVRPCGECLQWQLLIREHDGIPRASAERDYDAHRRSSKCLRYLPDGDPAAITDSGVTA